METVLIYNEILKIVSRWYSEHRHGHFLVFRDGDETNDENENISFIEIKNAFKDRNKVMNWKEGLKKDEIIFVNEYWDEIKGYFQKRELEN
tara:strand:+ start:24046 stop:24318 length:273 start_codon:yes stop_codon:yes gene_type:complete